MVVVVVVLVVVLVAVVVWQCGVLVWLFKATFSNVSVLFPPAGKVTCMKLTFRCSV